MSFTTVYQLSHGVGIIPFLMSQPILLALLGLFALVALVLSVPPVSNMERITVSVTGLRGDVKQVRKLVWIANGVIWIALFFLHNSQLRKEAVLINAYEDKQCEEVGGPIKKLRSVQDEDNGAFESFEVGGKKFICYQSAWIKAGLNAHDIARLKLEDGQHARIWFLNDSIVRVDVAK